MDWLILIVQTLWGAVYAVSGVPCPWKSSALRPLGPLAAHAKSARGTSPSGGLCGTSWMRACPAMVGRAKTAILHGSGIPPTRVYVLCLARAIPKQHLLAG
jgi:hypothetical protein